MADTIIRLKVESTEYEGKIKRAVQGMQQLEKHVRDTGASFEVAEKADLEFVRALGQMETKATSNKGKLAELKNAFVELSVQYKNLSDAEKKSDFGKALNSSLDQLKGRIDDIGSKIKEANTEMDGMGGFLKNLGDKIGIPSQMFTKMGVAVAAAGTALKVATDAFKANESLVDEWGSVVQQATSVYEGFLISLNTGDFAGFFTRMNDILSSARNVYNEFDRLGTMRTIQSVEASAQSAENERIRAMIQTRRYIAPLDGSAGIAGMESGAMLSDDQVRQLEQDLQSGIQRITELIKNEINQSTNAINAEYERQAGLLGITVDEFRMGTSTMAEFERRLEMARRYQEFETEHTTTQMMNTSAGMIASSYRDNAVNPYAGYEAWSVFRVDGEAYQNLVRLISERDAQTSAAYSAQAQSYRTINSSEGIRSRIGSDSDSGSGSGSNVQIVPEGSIAKLRQDISKLRQEWELAINDESREQKSKELEILEADLARLLGAVKEVGYQAENIKFNKEGLSEVSKYLNGLFNDAEFNSEDYLLRAENIADLGEFQRLLKIATENGISVADFNAFKDSFDKLKLGLDIDDETWTVLEEEINAKLEEMGIKLPVNVDVKTDGEGGKIAENASKAKEGWQAAANAIGDIGGALQQVEDPSAKVAGIVMEAIASIALGFSKSTIAAAGGGPIAWIASTVSGLATMIGTIAAIKNATKFADGGMVGGNSYSGDNIVARLNSGEGVLTANGVRNAQAMAANANPMSNIIIQGTIKGHDILLSASNYARYIGKTSGVSLAGGNALGLPIIMS